MRQTLTALDILSHLIDWGGHFSNSQARLMLAYFDQMLSRGRCLTLYEHGALVGVCTFFVLDARTHVESWQTCQPWSTPQDEEGGTMIYIDFFATERWTKALRKEVEDQLAWRFPQFTHAVYFRFGNSLRKLVIPRRRCLDGATV